MMTANELLRLLWRNALLIVTVSAMTGAAVFFLTLNAKRQYSSKSLVSTGVIYPFSLENPNASNRVDRDYALSELENLISLATAYETLEELGMRLMAEYLHTSADTQWAMSETLTALRELPLGQLRQEMRALDSPAAVYDTLRTLMVADPRHPLHPIIYKDEDHFGVDYLAERLRVNRKGQSDLLEFLYTTSDPVLCQRTLNVLIDIFMRRHAELKKGKTSRVVSYFQEATQESEAKLRQAEQALLAFRTENNIINFDEQTRSIAERKEDLDELSFKEKMTLQGNEATMARVEQQLGDRKRLADMNASLLTQRKEYAQITEQLASMDIAAIEATPPNPAVRQKLDKRLAELGEQMRDYARERYNVDQTPDGIATQDLLSELLTAMMASEQSRARSKVIQQRQKEFADIYKQYAPWGSQIKRIEREISMAEDAYLTNLHSYNQAILHRENALMASNLKVMDAPFYPTEPSSSKRLLLILGGLIAGGLLSAGSLIGLAFVDTSLQSARFAMAETGLEFGAVLPNFARLREGSSKAKRLHTAADRALSIFLQQIKVETMRRQAMAKRLMVTSAAPEEGKTFVSLLLAAALRQEGARVLFLFPEEDEEMAAATSLPHPDNQAYALDVRSIHRVIPDKLYEEGSEQNDDDAAERYDYVIMEMPSLLTGAYPVNMLSQFDLVAFVCRANRTWREVDKQALAALQKATECPIRLVLNGTSQEALEDYMGELPRHHSRRKKRKLI